MIGQRVYRKLANGNLSAYPIGWIRDMDDTHYLIEAMKGDKAQLLDKSDPTLQIMVWYPDSRGDMRLISKELYERIKGGK